MAATGNLSPESQRLLADYLDRVAGVLFRSGLERQEIEGILGDLRAQVYETLAAQSGASPTDDDVRAVIANLDPPESYAQEPEATKKTPRFSRLAILGACWGVVFFPCIILAFTAHEVRVIPGQPLPGPTLLENLLRFTVLPLGLAAPFAMTILGLLAITRIRNSAGRLVGMSLAVADALLFPLLILNGLFYWGIYTGFQIWLERGEYAGKIEPLSLITTLLLSLIVDFIIARQAWKAANKP